MPDRVSQVVRGSSRCALSHLKGTATWKTSRRQARQVLTYSMTIMATLLCLSLLISCGERGESVSIDSFTPEGEIPQTSNFTILFSHDVVSDSIIGVESDDLPVTFNPEVPGKFIWIASDKLRFFPEAMLAPSTEYTVKVSGKLTEAYGYRLSGEDEFKVRTPRLRVESASLLFDYIPETNKEINLLATLEFNNPVDPAEVVKDAALKYADGRRIALTLVSDSISSIVSMRAERVPRDEHEKELTLVIASGLTCDGCGLGLAMDYSKQVTLPGQTDLKIEGVTPIRESPTRGYIRVELNAPVQAASAARYVTIEPTLDYRVNANYRYLDLVGQFDVGTSYEVHLAKGLKAIDGSPLERDFSTAVTFRKVDIPPQISFAGEGFYLTRSGNLNLGISTINVDSVKVEVERVFANNLVYLLNTTDLTSQYGYYYMEALGTHIADTAVEVDRIDNEEVVTPFAVADLVRDHGNGVFHFTASSTETRWRRAQTWVLATDMGIVAKQSGSELWVWVNSLTGLEAIAGVEVKVYSRNNQLLLTSRTDDKGIVRFADFARRTEGFTPYLVTATSGDDFCFLELERRRISTTDFDAGGLPILSDGYDAFIYNERGIYRPGETAHLGAIIRGVSLATPTPFPVKLTTRGPDNRILDEQRASFSSEGMVDFAVAVPDYAKTGKYSSVLTVGDKDEIGRTSFSVEEFVPDRMKVKISTPKLDYPSGEKMSFTVEGVTLFGPPASDRRVDASVELEALPYNSDRWKSFTFGDYRKSFDRREFKLEQQSLDQDGRHDFQFQIPKELDPPSSLRGIITATVLEPGGRGVTAYYGVSVHPHDTYVGLRRESEGYAAPNKETQVDLVVVRPDGEPVPDHQIEVSLYRVIWQSVLRQTTRSEGYRYVSERVEQLQNSFLVSSTADVSHFTVTPGDYGRYLVVARDQQSGATSALSFYASGWGYSPWAMDNPDRVKLDLDKEEYSPGEIAQLQVRAPFSGKLLVTVESDKVLDYQVVTLKENTATLQIDVKDGYTPNVYISAHLIRSTKSLDRDTPVRAFGVRPLMVNTGNQHLQVELEAPEVMLPKRKLTVTFHVSGSDNKAVPVTIAAVDEGILQLTDFQTPDPHEHFLGKRRLGIETQDVYGMILPEIKSKSATGGDVEAARKRHLTPISIRRVKPLALWSGILHTDSRGFGKVSFDIPEFSGTVRLMAVAASENRFGNGEKKVIVRRPLQMTPTFPRFLAGGDKFSVPVSVYNGTGQKTTATVKLTASGPVRLLSTEAQSIELNNNEEKAVYFDVSADRAIGKAEFLLTASAAGEESSMQVEVPIRPPVPAVTVAGSGVVEPGIPTTFTFPDEWIEGTTDFELSISSFPAVRFSGSLQYLLRYPHGCLEQTVSRVFPLLYLDDLARMAEPELFQHNSADYYIEEGIQKLASMITGAGEFDFWPDGNYVSRWGTVYATHFLVEARKEGYTIPDRVYDAALKALRGYSRDYEIDNREKQQVALYACYVLALAGQPDRSSMNFFKDNLPRGVRDYSQYQLAGAFALTGDMASARMLLPKSAAPVESEPALETGGNFNSTVRAKAIMLDVLSQVDPKNPMVPLLVEDLNRAAANTCRWYTTQENAFALMALGKIMRLQGGGSFTGSASVAGAGVLSFDTQGGRVSNREWSGKEVKIAIEGNGSCYYYWRADGLPTGDYIDEYDKDLQVRRRLLDEEGHSVDYESLKQGDLLVAEIKVTAPNQAIENVAVVDLLPAGLEIENPRLQSRRSLPWIEKRNAAPQYIDFRDDRMIFYTGLRHAETFTFYYSLRAVTVGEFILPPVRAEAMYAPMKASVASSGRIQVIR